MISDTKCLVQEWKPGEDVDAFAQRVHDENILGTYTAYRARDIVRRVFAPRYMRPDDRPARLLKRLVERRFPQKTFTELLFLFCARADRLLYDFTVEVYWRAAHRGRDPELYLLRQGEEVRLRDWAQALCAAMAGVCELLDTHTQGTDYSGTLQRQVAKISNPDLTPSALMLAEMRANGEGFFHFAQRLSRQHHDYFRRLTLDPGRIREFEDEARRSHARQRELESAPQTSFAQFLHDYFSQ